MERKDIKLNKNQLQKIKEYANETRNNYVYIPTYEEYEMYILYRMKDLTIINDMVYAMILNDVYHKVKENKDFTYYGLVGAALKVWDELER